jgi:hypothetical protein
MKRITICRFAFYVVVLMLAAHSPAECQPSAPPGEHGLNGNQGPGGAAPVDGGSLFLLLSGLGYGGYKLIRKRRKMGRW